MLPYHNLNYLYCNFRLPCPCQRHCSRASRTSSRVNTCERSTLCCCVHPHACVASVLHGALGLVLVWLISGVVASPKNARIAYFSFFFFSSMYLVLYVDNFTLCFIIPACGIMISPIVGFCVRAFFIFLFFYHLFWRDNGLDYAAIGYHRQ